jgi:hypothetical protein
LVLILISSPLFSQGNAGRILGSVTDQTGGVLAGATVTVTDTQRGVTRMLTTDESGAYNAPNLLPGTYSVRAEVKGFSPVERQNIILEVAKEIRVDLVLSPGRTDTNHNCDRSASASGNHKCHSGWNDHQ